VRKKKINTIAASLVVMLIFAACGSYTASDSDVYDLTTIRPYPTVLSTATYEPIEVTEVRYHTETPIVDKEPFSEEEVEAISKTLAGECYDDKPNDKRLVRDNSLVTGNKVVQ